MKYEFDSYTNIIYDLGHIECLIIYQKNICFSRKNAEKQEKIVAIKLIASPIYSPCTFTSILDTK